MHTTGHRQVTTKLSKRPARDSNRRPQRLEGRTLTATPPSPLFNESYNKLSTIVYVEPVSTRNSVLLPITHPSTYHMIIHHIYTSDRGDTYTTISRIKYRVRACADVTRKRGHLNCINFYSVLIVCFNKVP